jgi:hypothetical protein
MRGLSFVADENGEFRAKQLAEAASVTEFLPLDDWNIVTLLVDLLGIAQNLHRTENRADPTTLAEFLIDVNHRAVFR